MPRQSSVRPSPAGFGKCFFFVQLVVVFLISGSGVMKPISRVAPNLASVGKDAPTRSSASVRTFFLGGMGRKLNYFLLQDDVSVFKIGEFR